MEENTVADLTLEEHRAKMAEIEARLSELTGMSRAAFTNPDHVPTWGEIVTECDGLVDDYKWHAETVEMILCRDSEDPMMTAVKDLEYNTVVVKTRSEDVGGGKVNYLQTDFVAKQINLLKLDKFCGGIGKDSKWIPFIEKLGLKLTLKAAKSIGITPEDISVIDSSYNMSALAREIKLARDDASGSTPDPVSKNQMIKTLDLIIAAMIGDEFKCDTRDVAFLEGCFTKKGRKALTLKASNNKELTGLIHQICHRVALGKAYSIDAYVKKPR